MLELGVRPAWNVIMFLLLKRLAGPQKPSSLITGLATAGRYCGLAHEPHYKRLVADLFTDKSTSTDRECSSRIQAWTLPMPMMFCPPGCFAGLSPAEQRQSSRSLLNDKFACADGGARPCRACKTTASRLEPVPAIRLERWPQSNICLYGHAHGPV